MERVAAKAEAVFAKALELTTGAARARFVAEQCAGDPGLRGEVESLLQAHEEAAGFLMTAAEQKETAGQQLATLARQSTVALNAATQAEVFLRNPSANAGAGLEDFIATLPAALRQEVRERIEAGLRVRQIAPARNRPAPEAKKPAAPAGFPHRAQAGCRRPGQWCMPRMTRSWSGSVALKVLHRQADETVRRRVLDEARKTAALTDPAIVTMFSVLDETEPPAIVMELVEGFPLDRFAAQLNFEQKARLLREVARGLGGGPRTRPGPSRSQAGQYASSARTCARAFLTSVSRCRWKRPAARNAGSRARRFTPRPSRCAGKPLTAASDVFSFGSLMFKVLAGRPAFAGRTVNASAGSHRDHGAAVSARSGGWRA